MTNVPSTFPKPADIDDGRDDATTKYDALSLDVGVVDAADRQQELELRISTSKWRAGGVGVGPVAKFGDLRNVPACAPRHRGKVFLVFLQMAGRAPNVNRESRAVRSHKAGARDIYGT